MNRLTRAATAAALCLLAGLAAADERPARRTIQKTAQVTAVDADNQSLAIVVARDSGRVEESFKLAPGAKVLVDGQPAALKDVPKGATVALVLNAPAKDGEPLTIAEARVSGPTVGGALKSIDGSTVTLGGERGDRAFKLAASAAVTVNGKPAKAADLKPGDRVAVTLSAKGDTAVAVASGAARDGGEGGRPPARRPIMNGLVGAVDAKTGAVTLFWVGEGGPREGTVNVGPETAITIDGKPAKLADFKGVGSAEVFAPRPERGQPIVPTEIAFKAQTFVAVVREANATSVTLLGGPDTTKPGPVIKLDTGCAVLIDGKASKPTDLQAGDRATITLNADRTAAVRITVGAVKRDGERPKGDRPNR